MPAGTVHVIPFPGAARVESRPFQTSWVRQVRSTHPEPTRPWDPTTRPAISAPANQKALKTIYLISNTIRLYPREEKRPVKIPGKLSTLHRPKNRASLVLEDEGMSTQYTITSAAKRGRSGSPWHDPTRVPCEKISKPLIPHRPKSRCSLVLEDEDAETVQKQIRRQDASQLRVDVRPLQ